jgi:hypothetical protein
MVEYDLNPAGLVTENDCAGENQQQQQRVVPQQREAVANKSQNPPLVEKEVPF